MTSHRLEQVREDDWQTHLNKAIELTEKIRAVRPNQDNYNDRLVQTTREFYISIKKTIDIFPRSSSKWRDYRQGKIDRAQNIK